MKYQTAMDNIYYSCSREISILVRNTLSIFRGIFGYFIQVGTMALKYSLCETERICGVALCLFVDKELPFPTNWSQQWRTT